MIKVLYCNEKAIINSLAESLVIGGLPKQTSIGDYYKEISELEEYLEFMWKLRTHWKWVNKDGKPVLRPNVPNEVMMYFDNETNLEMYCSKFDKYIKRGMVLGGVKQGSGHDCMFKGVQFNMIIQFPLVWLKEYQRYHFTDIISSQSTMHKMTEFDLEVVYDGRVDPIVKERMQYLVDKYNNTEDKVEKENLWETIVFTNPSGFQLVQGITMNYLQAKSMVAQRKYHKLDEWSEDLIPYLSNLPFYKLFIEGVLI
nr:MAG TPA: hypothetical protein [Caudoviricetes sp.]